MTFAAMPKNYRRGITRFYVLFSVLWLIWGMYRPIADRNRSFKSERVEQERDFHSCQAENDKNFKEAKKFSEKYGILLAPLQTDCLRYEYRRHQDTIESYQRETLFDTYWRVGGWKMAAYCVLPPLAGYLLILAVWWAIAGFWPVLVCWLR
jgi:hypothetical protein